MPDALTDSVPELLMPPLKIAPPIEMAVWPPLIMFVASSEMPPLMTPALRTEPLIVPPTKAMPEGLIDPSLVMLLPGAIKLASMQTF